MVNFRDPLDGGSGRPLRPLLPATRRPSRGEPVQVKRSKVSAACSGCRSRKTKCSAERPKCGECISRNTSCEYTDAQKPLRQRYEDLRSQQNAYEELLNQLLTLPESESLDVLRRIRAGNDAGLLPFKPVTEEEGVELIRKWKQPSKRTADEALAPHSHPAIYRPSDLRTARSIRPPTYSVAEFELTVVHSNAYPNIITIETSSIDIDILLKNAPRAWRGLSPDLFTSKDGSLIEYNSSAFPFRNVQPRNSRSMPGPLQSASYCDDRLKQLEIAYWTTVPIDTSFAASVISYFLEVYHPFMTFFDAELVLVDLVEHRPNFCTSFLINALLYFACQSYTCIDRRAILLAYMFSKEAERLWRAEGSEDTPEALSATMLLAQANTVAGNHHLAIECFGAARQKGIRMGLFGVSHQSPIVTRYHSMPHARLTTHMYSAWGAYNLLSVRLYFQTEQEMIVYPPALPIPGDTDVSWPLNGSSGNPAWQPQPLPGYMGSTFTHLSRLCVIVQEIQIMYRCNTNIPIPERASLAFAESKYQKLLQWSDTLPKSMTYNEKSENHIFVFCGFLHTIIIELFQPFIQQEPQPRLKSFSSEDTTPRTLVNASVRQLKQLTYLCFAQLQSTSWSSLLTISIVPLVTVLFRSTEHADWDFYFKLCLEYGKKMNLRYPIYGPFVRAWLTMAMEKDYIKIPEAQLMIEEVSNNGKHHENANKARTTALMDLELAMTAPNEAQTEALANKFEELIVFDEFVV